MIYFGVCIFLVFLPTAAGDSFISSPPAAVTIIEGQTLELTWVVKIDTVGSFSTAKLSFEVDGTEIGFLFYNHQFKTVTPKNGWASRAADLSLNITVEGVNVTIVFTMTNVNKGTDEGEYILNSASGSNTIAARVPLTVNVPPTITSSHPYTIAANETQTVELVCNSTGFPTPTVNWTKDGVVIGTGNPYSIQVTPDDHNRCYTCVVFNGVYGAKTANVCLAVQYKPYGAHDLTFVQSTVCQNSTVNMTCTSGPSNPAASKFIFYYGDVVVQSGSSNVYVGKALNGAPEINKYSCIPGNILGDAENNVTSNVIAKVTPIVTDTTDNPVVEEGSNLNLSCSVSGTEPLTVTWTRAGKANTQGNVYTITNINRNDEGLYRCTVDNGVECPENSADINVTVNFKPESTSITSNRNNNTFLKGEEVTLLCSSLSKPQRCNVTFYHGNDVIGSYTDKICNGAVAASHIIPNIDGCGLKEFSCQTENEYGSSGLSNISLTINVPATISTIPTESIVVLQEGSSLDLNCSTTGCPEPNITWSKLSNSLQSSIGGLITQIFSSLAKGDSGTYTCTVDNKVVGSPITKSIYVNVTYTPYNTRMTSTHSRTCLNDSVTLSCTTDANPPVHEYRFYLNDKVIHTSPSGVYQFPVSHSGNNTYKCEPINHIGPGVNDTINIFTKDPPKITFSSPSKTFIEGEQVSLVCNVTGSKPLNITWSRLAGASYPQGSVKTFSTIRREDEATYQCKASNGNECPVATASSMVTVIYKPENTSLITSTNVACYKDIITLTCTSHAKPAPHTYQFYRNGISIANTSNGIYTYNMTVNGTNVYTCVPENIVGPGANDSVTVQVKVTPTILSVTADNDVLEGSNVPLVCDVWDNSGSLHVSWHRVGGGVLVNSSTYTITSINRAQTGSFECHANNGNECIATSKKVTINVKYTPSILQSSESSQDIDENDDIVLTCKADGYPNPTVSWTKDGSFEVIHTGQSLVRKATPDTKGAYKCSVTNGVGQTKTKQFTINVIGYCSQHQCRPGSKCVSKKKSYFCNCTRGLAGQFCEKEDPLDRRFEVVMVFVKPVWEDSLNDKTSEDFKAMAKMICDKMFEIFDNSLVYCSVIKMRFSSIYTETELRFNQSKLQSEVENTIQNAALNGTNLSPDLVLKGTDSIKANPYVTPCSNQPCKFDGVCTEKGDSYECECKLFRHGKDCEQGIGIVPGFIIIAICLLLIFITIILCCLYYRRSKSHYYEKENAENGNDYKLDEIQRKAAKDHVASSSNYSFEEEYLANGRYENLREKHNEEEDDKKANNNTEHTFKTFNKNYDNDEREAKPQKETETATEEQEETEKQKDNLLPREKEKEKEVSNVYSTFQTFNKQVENEPVRAASPSPIYALPNKTTPRDDDHSDTVLTAPDSGEPINNDPKGGEYTDIVSALMNTPLNEKQEDENEDGSKKVHFKDVKVGHNDKAPNVNHNLEDSESPQGFHVEGDTHIAHDGIGMDPKESESNIYPKLNTTESRF